MNKWNPGCSSTARMELLDWGALSIRGLNSVYHRYDIHHDDEPPSYEGFAYQITALSPVDEVERCLRILMADDQSSLVSGEFSVAVSSDYLDHALSFIHDFVRRGGVARRVIISSYKELDVAIFGRPFASSTRIGIQKRFYLGMMTARNHISYNPITSHDSDFHSKGANDEEIDSVHP